MSSQNDKDKTNKQMKKDEGEAEQGTGTYTRYSRQTRDTRGKETDEERREEEGKKKKH